MSLRKLVLFFTICMIAAVPSAAADNFPFSQVPPGGLKASQCPMFVLFAFDDNCYADGLIWARNLFKDLKNADGSAARATFMLIGSCGADDPSVLAAWNNLYQDGHGIGNHSWDHPEGAAFSVQGWDTEITKTNTFLEANLGISANQIKGFRTPYLEYSANTMQAVVSNGFLFDCSMEFGYNGWEPGVGDPDYPPATSGVWWNSMQSTRTFKKLFWPYTLDQGSPPGNSATGNPIVPGLWEVPVYTWLRSDTTAGVVTGFDFNLWTTATREIFAKTLEMNFDLRYNGNRSPLLISAHTDYYSVGNADAETAFPNAHYQDRQLAMEDILTYVRQFPETRIVPVSTMIAWMKNPTPLGATPGRREKAGAAAPFVFSIISISRDRVEFSLPRSGEYTFPLMSLQGSLMERHTGYRDAGAHAVFPIKKALPAGAYLVCLRNGPDIVLERIISIRYDL